MKKYENFCASLKNMKEINEIRYRQKKRGVI